MVFGIINFILKMKRSLLYSYRHKQRVLQVVACDGEKCVVCAGAGVGTDGKALSQANIKTSFTKFTSYLQILMVKRCVKIKYSNDIGKKKRDERSYDCATRTRDWKNDIGCMKRTRQMECK